LKGFYKFLLADDSEKVDRKRYSVPGSFAVGDVRAGSVKRLATAVGEGSMAITFVHKHLREAT
jgi:thioredoxin reductase